MLLMAMMTMPHWKSQGIYEQQKEQTKNVRGIMSTIDLSHQKLLERFPPIFN